MDKKNLSDVTKEQDLTQTDLIRMKSRNDLSRLNSEYNKTLPVINTSVKANSELTVSVSKKKVRFDENHISVIRIQSYKKYNAENNKDNYKYDDEYYDKSIDCKCYTF